MFSVHPPAISLIDRYLTVRFSIIAIGEVARLSLTPAARQVISALPFRLDENRPPPTRCNSAPLYSFIRIREDGVPSTHGWHAAPQLRPPLD